LILVGSDKGTSLWLDSYKLNAGSFIESASWLESLPHFLTQNVSGKVTFRGADMIFSIARPVVTGKFGTTLKVAEADSATYKFWLHQTEGGYILMPHLPDEDQFQVVRQFLEALAANRTDAAKALLVEPTIVSIPKYVKVQGPSDNYRVAQLASPPSGVLRYRLITSGKDDLIFDVVTKKDKFLIRAIFIAPPDPFVQEIGKQFPAYSRLAPPILPPASGTSTQEY